MELIKQITVKASADDAWRILSGDFANIHKWASSVSDSFIKGNVRRGAIRSCMISSNIPFFRSRTIKERVLILDHKNMLISYEVISGLPSFIKQAKNTWSVCVLNEQECLIKMHSSVELDVISKPFTKLISLMINKETNKLKDELRFHIENGTPYYPSKKLIDGAVTDIIYFRSRPSDILIATMLIGIGLFFSIFSILGLFPIEPNDTTLLPMFSLAFTCTAGFLGYISLRRFNEILYIDHKYLIFRSTVLKYIIAETVIHPQSIISIEKDEDGNTLIKHAKGKFYIKGDATSFLEKPSSWVEK